MNDCCRKGAVGADGGSGNGFEPGFVKFGSGMGRRETKGSRRTEEAIGVSGREEACGGSDVAEGVA